MEQAFCDISEAISGAFVHGGIDSGGTHDGAYCTLYDGKLGAQATAFCGSRLDGRRTHCGILVGGSARQTPATLIYVFGVESQAILAWAFM